jgi:type IV conjugative transfer system lipoprotein TraV
MKRVILLIFLVMISGMFGGCAKMLSIGHENFKCVGDSENGRCTDVRAIYDNRHEIASGEIFKEKTDKRVKKDNKDVVVDVTDKYETDYDKKFHFLLTAEGKVPLRYNDTVRKVYIMPFINKNGNMIGGFHAYFVDRNGKWVLPDEVIQ